MNISDQIATTIRRVCQRNELLADIKNEEDFFEHGASSLSVIEMQIRIEETLHVSVPTSALMERPTIKDWIDLYFQTANASAEVETQAYSD